MKENIAQQTTDCKTQQQLQLLICSSCVPEQQLLQITIHSIHAGQHYINDNFATTKVRKVCNMSKVSEFCLEWNA